MAAPELINYAGQASRPINTRSAPDRPRGLSVYGNGPWLTLLYGPVMGPLWARLRPKEAKGLSERPLAPFAALPHGETRRYVLPGPEGRGIAWTRDPR